MPTCSGSVDMGVKNVKKSTVYSLDHLYSVAYREILDIDLAFLEQICTWYGKETGNRINLDIGLFSSQTNVYPINDQSYIVHSAAEA